MKCFKFFHAFEMFSFVLAISDVSLHLPVMGEMHVITTSIIACGID